MKIPSLDFVAANKLSSKELLLLKIRDCISSKEFETASANRELQQFGSWSCDHPNAILHYDQEISKLIKEYEN